MTKLLDPVCGMTVGEDALRAPGYEDVAFCAPGCRTTFLKDPNAYSDRLDVSATSAGHHDEGAESAAAQSESHGCACCSGDGH